MIVGGFGHILSPSSFKATEPCPTCNGIGKVLTDRGLDLMAFFMFWSDKLATEGDD